MGKNWISYWSRCIAGLSWILAWRSYFYEPFHEMTIGITAAQGRWIPHMIQLLWWYVLFIYETGSGLPRSIVSTIWCNWCCCDIIKSRGHQLSGPTRLHAVIFCGPLVVWVYGKQWNCKKIVLRKEITKCSGTKRELTFCHRGIFDWATQYCNISIYSIQFKYFNLNEVTKRI